MNACFADSFYYLALLNRRDASHERVTALARSLNGPAVTTTWVLTEVADALSHPAERASVVRLVQTLRASARTEIVPASSELFERGWQLYCERPDKDWSLTDCISFAVMRQRGLTDALTADQHFEQAGFTVLLK